MNAWDELKTNITRRHFFAQGSHAVGWAALAMLLGRDGVGQTARGDQPSSAPAPQASASPLGPHFPLACDLS